MKTEIQFVFHFSFSWRKWKTNCLNRSRLILWLLLQVWSTRYSRASSCQVPWGFLLWNGHAGTKNPLFRKQLMYFNVYCWLLLSYLVHFNGFLIVKVDLKYKQKPRKINVKDFILCSVARIILLIWNTLSCSNKLFPLRRTNPH